MGATLKNDFGTVSYTDNTIALIAGVSATESYGLVGMSQKSVTDMLAGLFRSDNLKKGVDVITDHSENVVIKLYITVKYGVSLAAVAENIIEKVKYSVEKETGLNVESVDIVVQGIQV